MRINEVMMDDGQLNLLHSFPSPAVVVDKDGNINVKNEEWIEKQERCAFLRDVSEKGNLFDYCIESAERGSDDALKLVMGLRRTLDGDLDKFHSSFQSTLDNTESWYRIHIRPFGEQTAILYAEDITSRVKATEDLKESRERYRQQFDHSLNGIIIGTPDGEVIDANAAACKILGYTKEELREIGRQGIMDESHPLNKEASRIRQEQTYFEGEKQYIHKTGRDVSVMVSSVVFRDKKGQLSTINSFRDITKEKKFQEKLKSEQEFARTAISSIPGTFYVLDSGGSFLEWNDVFTTDLGYSEEDMFGMKPEDLFHPDDRNMINQKLAETIREGSAQIVSRVLTKSGEERVFKLNARRFKNGDNIYVVGTGLDITELIRAKNSSDHNFRLMNQLFENSPIGIVMINEDNKIERVNNGFRNMFGYMNGDVVGSNVNDLITDENTRAFADKISRNAFDGKLSQTESIRYAKDGTEIPVLVSAVPVSDGDRVVAVYGLYVNLTEQKALENRIKELLKRETRSLQETQKTLKEKEILLQEIHHRVKNNLAVIAGLLDLQLLEEEDQHIYRKLSEVQSRIFSIAKIHETLYQEDNVVDIHFDNYLKSFLKFLPQQGFHKEVISELTLTCSETTLNLNQAVPAGLMVNELMNILLPDNCRGTLNLILNSSENIVEIKLQGCGLKLNNFEKDLQSGQFQYKLIDILVAQLDGTIDVNQEERYISIKFQKSEVKGSSNALF